MIFCGWATYSMQICCLCFNCSYSSRVPLILNNLARLFVAPIWIVLVFLLFFFSYRDLHYVRAISLVTMLNLLKSAQQDLASLVLFINVSIDQVSVSLFDVDYLELWYSSSLDLLGGSSLKPVSANSDQDQFSPSNIHTLSTDKL